MEIESILHMNTGDGDSSYACNSFLQETVMWKMLPVLKHTIKGMANNGIIFRNCLIKIADLGCSSSINSLLAAHNIIHMIYYLCEENNYKPPQFEVCLNDLFENDFNTILKMVPTFYSNLKKEKGEHLSCFVSATPGSFYGRLFPKKSLHLVHSCYALHWLSQAPEGVENNTSNIYMSKSSPPNVFEAYQKQFYIDFGNFLQLRSEELLQGGCMVLVVVGRSIVDPTSDDCCKIWELLSQSLLDMVKEGLIQESKFGSFNMPYYNPCEDEIRNVIQIDGSFSLDMLNVFQVNWDPEDADYTNMKDLNEQSHIHGKNAVKALRAVVEPLLTSHFGHSIMDMVFDKFEKHVALHLAKKKTRYFNLVISLSKK